MFMPVTPDHCAGFAAGARVALDNAIPFLPACAVRELEDWLADLDGWRDGPMPPAPMDWPEYNPT